MSTVLPLKNVFKCLSAPRSSMLAGDGAILWTPSLLREGPPPPTTICLGGPVLRKSRPHVSLPIPSLQPGEPNPDSHGHLFLPPSLAPLPQASSQEPTSLCKLCTTVSHKLFCRPCNRVGHWIQSGQRPWGRVLWSGLIWTVWDLWWYKMAIRWREAKGKGNQCKRKQNQETQA